MIRVNSEISRRRFGASLAFVAAGLRSSLACLKAAEGRTFKLKYLLASSMYGKLPVRDILPEVRKTGAEWIDIWPQVHGNQREQIDEMGHAPFARLLEQHGVRLGCLTRYDLGPYGLQSEMAVAQAFDCPLIVCGGRGPKGLSGSDLKAAVRKFVESMKPHLERAAEHGLSIAIENHGNNLVDSPDSLKWMVDLSGASNLKVALAPYHLENLGIDEKGLATLIRSLGNEIAIFYAWQHGMGCMTKLPKEQELLQMPGRGDFDFELPVEALREVAYSGFTEVFMHPVPRGIPILPSLEETTKEINLGRSYLEGLVALQ